MIFEDIMLNGVSQSQKDILNNSTYMSYLKQSNPSKYKTEWGS